MDLDKVLPVIAVSLLIVSIFVAVLSSEFSRFSFDLERDLSKMEHALVFERNPEYFENNRELREFVLSGERWWRYGGYMSNEARKVWQSVGYPWGAELLAGKVAFFQEYNFSLEKDNVVEATILQIQRRLRETSGLKIWISQVALLGAQIIGGFGVVLALWFGIALLGDWSTRLHRRYVYCLRQGRKLVASFVGLVGLVLWTGTISSLVILGLYILTDVFDVERIYSVYIGVGSAVILFLLLAANFLRAVREFVVEKRRGESLLRFGFIVWVCSIPFVIGLFVAIS